MNDLDLFAPAHPRTRTRHDELEQAAREFHAENPEVWRLFVRFTLEAVGRGFSAYSVAAIFERIRWETDVADAEGRSTFKLNNNHRASYARWFMATYPQCRGFFRLREQSSKHQVAIDLDELTPGDFPYVQN
jgi:hypothetical protein